MNKLSKLLGVFSFCLPLPVMAQNLTNIVDMEVLPGWTTADGGQMAGLRITLAPGWKTYWRAPGDTGIPPLIQLDGASNIASLEMLWPTPEVFYQNGMRSIGYQNQVVLPLDLGRVANGDIRLSGTISLGVCEEICVPVELAFDTILTEGGNRDPAIVAALVDQPLGADEAGVTAAECTIAPSDYGLSLVARVMLPQLSAREEVVIEAGNDEVWVSEPEVTRTDGQLVAQVEMMHVSGGAFALDRSSVRITILGGDTAVDIKGCSAG